MPRVGTDLEVDEMSRIAESLAGIAGLDVSMAETELGRYSGDDSGLLGEQPRAVLRPRTVPALVKLVRLAPALGLRLQPVSSTGEHHRGDTLCEADTAIVDLSAFDEVVRVDRRNRVALFEAGVSFDRLTLALREQGLRPMLPLCPRPGKSALAAYLEREPTIMPRFQWDLSDPLLCVEAVFGNGELFRTGAAAGPGTLEEQWATGNAQKTPMGPGHSDVARLLQGAQGNLGIVTWCTAKAEPIPQGETLYRLSSADLGKLTSLSQVLLRRNLPDICFMVDSAALAALQGRSIDGADRQWHLIFSLSAPSLLGREKLDWMQEEVASYCNERGLSSQLQGFAAQHEDLHRRLLDPAAGAGEGWWKKAGLPATRELFFQTTLDHCQRFLPLLHQRLAAIGWLQRPLIYIQPQLGGRCCHMEFVFPHDPARRSTARVNALITELACELKVEGAFFSRPYGPLVDIARAGLSTTALTDRLTEVFDPAGVMSGSRWAVCRHRAGLARVA
jgi:hypothetical protein